MKIKILSFFLLILFALPALSSETVQQPKEKAKSEKAQGKYYCPMHPEVTSNEPSNCSICNMKLSLRDNSASKELPMHDHDHAPKETATSAESDKPLYYCPMHPQVTSDKPGTCPICGMDLSLKKGNVGSKSSSSKNYPKGHDAIELSLERQQMIGVKLTKVERKKLFKKVRAPGRVAFDPELYTAQNEYQEALRQLRRVKSSTLDSVKKNVRRMVESAKIRLRVLGLSEEQIRAIRAGSNLSENLLLSKKGGKSWIYAEVFEMDLRNIKKGQSVRITSNYLEGKVIAGQVVSTDEVINPETRTARVRIQIEKTDVQFRPESYVDVEILVPQGEHLAIPEDAILDTGEERIVFASLGEGKFEPRKISILFRAQQEVAVGEGLSEGEPIVTHANFLIDSESRLKGVLTQMASGSE